MLFLIIFHALAGLLLSLAILTWGDANNALAFASGAGLSFFNILMLVFSWANILQKKLVALSISVIVIKFAILGWIIYEVTARQLFSTNWFTAGIALVVVSTVATAFWSAYKNPEKAEDQ